MNFKSQLLNSGLLVITSVIWGFAFVAQSTGGLLIGAFSFTSIRFLMASATLLIVVFIRRKKTKRNYKTLLVGGTVCGLLLSLATCLQQVGLNMGAQAGKAGFITAMYIVLVPILAFLILRKKNGWNVWLAVAIALVSLYLLCVNEKLSFEISDLLLMGCALTFAFQILALDKFTKDSDPIELSCVEFAVCGISAAIPMIITEIFPSPSLWASNFHSLQAWIPLLYAAVLSSGVGYTLQAVGQKGLNPTLASILMSLEAVFSLFAGWLILGQMLSAKELIGCGLMAIAVVLAQIPLSFFKKKPQPIQPPDEEIPQNQNENV